MKRIFTLIIIGILCLSVAWVLPSKVKAQQNLEAIVNGGFESGDLTGWSAGSVGDGGVDAVVTSNPHGGQYCACITGLGTLTQTFQGIPTSSIQSVTVWERTDISNYLQICELFYSDNAWDYIYGDITNSWSFFDVTSHLRTNKVLAGIFLGGWTLNSTPVNKYFDDVSILYTAPPQQSSTTNITAGINVTVNPTSDLELTFSNVTAAGYATTNKTSTVQAPLLANLAGQYYDIRVTASYSGNVTVSLTYDDANMTQPQENNLTMMQYTPIPGDVVNYGQVNILDISFIATRFGTTRASSNWNAAADINGDGKIDILDISICAVNYGKTSQWTNITRDVDTENNLVFGETSHFSIIGIHR